MAVFGLTEADFEATDNVGVCWPEHADAMHVFMGMQSQWNHGFDGVTGLNYSSLNAVYSGLRIKEENRPTVFHQLQVIEFETLSLISDYKKSRKASN
ncbi:MAG TPA: DUF1799 domain-containing protein [Methylophilus sp.]|uniref:DUF1799 domain-containing protein n=1 Tax=Methylophilus sp. TaxID=29541 RepID=UPI002CAD4608|nr:DUF1799 domain-containing protein [Methylophilus sp.]HSH86893.1 DUF1799 domain-containing protein [Methylophilus sp.]